MYVLAVVARLKPGVTRDAAQADLNALTAILAEEHPEQALRRDGTPRRYTVLSLQEAIVGDTATVLYMLLGAVGLLLAIACANVANLFLARGTERQREMATFRTMGYRAREVSRLFLRENLVTNVTGTLLGLPMGYAMLNGTMKGFVTDAYSFPAALDPISCAYTMALAIVFVLVAQIIVKSNLRALNWVQALSLKE